MTPKRDIDGLDADLDELVDRAKLAGAKTVATTDAVAVATRMEERFSRREWGRLVNSLERLQQTAYWSTMAPALMKQTIDEARVDFVTRVGNVLAQRAERKAQKTRRKS